MNTQEAVDKYALDFVKVFEQGAKKYAADGWLLKDGPKTDKKNQVKCFASHAAEYYAGITKDEESRLHPTLHIMCRAFIAYVRFREDI